MRRLLPVVTLFLLGLAAVAHAAVPSTLGYQGVLTDNVGNIQPDGLYNFVFKIYNVGSGGSALWTETDNNVQLTKGSFTVLLGNVTPINLPFDATYYLGISVNGQPELTPRVQLAASAYGLGLRLPFTGNGDGGGGAVFSITNTGLGPDIAADHSLRVGSGAIDGNVSVAGPGATAGLVNLYDYSAIFSGASPGGTAFSGGGAIDLWDKNNRLTMTLEPDADGLGGGYLYVNGDNAGKHFRVDGNSDFLGNPDVSIAGASTVEFNTATTGDASVVLPTASIDANEILDEPGIAQGRSTFTNSVTSVATMQDMAVVTLTTPAPGYIVLTAHAQAGLSGTTAANFLIAQIDDAAGGGENVLYSEYVGGTFSTTATYYMPYSNTRTYYEAAPGTYTFRFEAMKPAAVGSDYFYNPTLTAQFFPTSYGSVTTLVSAADAGRFASPQTVSGTSQDGRVTQSAAAVDLRDLELQVTREQTRLAAAQDRLRAAKVARQIGAITAARAKQQAALKPSKGGQ